MIRSIFLFVNLIFLQSKSRMIELILGQDRDIRIRRNSYSKNLQYDQKILIHMLKIKVMVLGRLLCMSIITKKKDKRHLSIEFC